MDTTQDTTMAPAEKQELARRLAIGAIYAFTGEPGEAAKVAFETEGMNPDDWSKFVEEHEDQIERYAGNVLGSMETMIVRDLGKKTSARATIADAIREDLANGVYSVSELAKKHGTTYQAVFQVVNKMPDIKKGVRLPKGSNRPTTFLTTNEELWRKHFAVQGGSGDSRAA